MLVLDNVCMKYPSDTGEIEALCNINIRVGDGEFVSVLGPSGCGKSTLLFIATGLTPCTSGQVLIDDKEITSPYHEVGFVFQDHLLLEWRKVLQNIAIQGELRGMPKKQCEKKAMELLNMVGLSDFYDKYPYELSGGMQQRVSICRALLHEPTLLMMDEPFGALDALTREQMRIDLERLWMKLGCTVLFVTHDINEAILLSDRVIILSSRPGSLILDQKIELPRPRSAAIADSEAFMAYKHQFVKIFMDMGVLHEE